MVKVPILCSHNMSIEDAATHTPQLASSFHRMLLQPALKAYKIRPPLAELTPWSLSPTH